MAQHVALYRKWRPLVFDDVLGQDHIVRALKAQVQGERISHAYLFTGTRGTGKTTCAKILARAACCRHPVNGNPCNECDACKAILADSALDVTEIDAASNNGVDNIRDIREEAAYAPAVLTRRVYIIDEVHMLSAGAFNALLKTLEEPPEHVLFILATTEIHKVPATILSRCQRYDFRRILPEVMAERLERIAGQEGFRLDKTAALLLARLGDGSMRDSLSLLDRSANSGDITVEQVTSALGVPSPETVTRLFTRIVASDTPGALEVFSQCYLDGRDIISLFDEMLSLIRDLYLVKTVGGQKYLMSACAFDEENISRLSGDVALAQLEYYVKCLSELLSRLTRTAVRRLDAEICLIKMCLGENEPEPAPTVRKKPPETPPKEQTRIETPPMEQEITPPQEKEAPAKEPDARKVEHNANKTPEGLREQLMDQVSAQLSPPVRAYLEMAECMIEGEYLTVEMDEESMIFVDKPKNHEIFNQGARALGFSGCNLRKKEARIPDAPMEVSQLLSRARSLGVPVGKKTDGKGV